MKKLILALAAAALAGCGVDYGCPATNSAGYHLVCDNGNTCEYCPPGYTSVCGAPICVRYYANGQQAVEQKLTAELPADPGTK